MGQCACIVIDPKTPELKDLKPTTPEYFLMLKIIKIQAVIKGFLVRRRLFWQKVIKYNQKVIELLNEFYDQQLRKFQKVGSYNFQKYEEKRRTVLRISQMQFKNPTVMEEGSLYIGEWWGDGGKWERAGRGIQIWSDGKVYEGLWDNDKMNGYGRLILANGNIYEGCMKDNNREGKGTLQSKDGSVFEGQWKEDKQHGYAEEKWPDGSHFNGNYLNNKKEGKGKYIWQDGASYEGDFKENQLEGQGDYKWPDNRRYNGQWVNNQMHGLGIFNWTDGRQYIGDFQMDRRSGFGIYTCVDNRLYYGHWDKGKQHGKGVIITHTNVKKLGEWTKGARQRWVIFDTQPTVAVLDKQYQEYTRLLNNNTLLNHSGLIDVNNIITDTAQLNNNNNNMDSSMFISNMKGEEDNLNMSRNGINIANRATDNNQMAASIFKQKTNTLQQSIDNIKMMQSTFKDNNNLKIV